MRQGTTLRARANQNRFREVSDPALRGVIYDSQGRILARNRPTFAIAVVPANLPDDEDALAAELSHLLDLLTMPISAVISPTATMTPEATARPTPTRVRGTPTPASTPTATPVSTPPLRLPVAAEDVAQLPRADLIGLIVQAVENARLGSAFAPVNVVLNPVSYTHLTLPPSDLA